MYICHVPLKSLISNQIASELSRFVSKGVFGPHSLLQVTLLSMRRPIWLAAAVLAMSTVPAISATPPKTGLACASQGTTKTYKGKKYICAKSGKKLAWSRSAIVKKPTPTPASTLSLAPTQAASLKAACKLPVADGRGDVAVGGFPRISERLKSVGEVITKVIFVDFPDEPARITPQSAFALISPMADLFGELSYGRMNYKLEPTYKWYRMKMNAKDYAPLNQSFVHHKNYMAEALTMADPDIDFSKTDNILIIANPDAQGTGTSGPAFSAIYGNGFTLDGRYISNGATSAYDLNYWKYIWANHEIGHALGLADLYAFRGEDATNPNDYHRFVGEYGLMGLSSLTANSPGFFAWERWVLDWLDDEQIYCMVEASTSQLITPVQRKGGLKAVIVPISRTKAVVVESRRAEGVDKNLSKAGALVYLVDSSIQSGFGPIRVYPAEKNDNRRLQSTRAVGESVTAEGVTVTVKSSNNGGDLVEVKRG